MPRVRVTRRFVREAVCPPERQKIDFFDTQQTGFLLEVRRSGGKTFYQRYTDRGGRTRQFRIGPADVLSLSAARRRGRAVVAQALIGPDPQDHRAQLRSIPTLEEFVRERFLPHVRSYKRSWRTDESLFRVHVMPMIGSHYLDTIHSEDIAAIIQRMRSEGYANGTTNHVVVTLRHLFNLANKWQIPGASNNPTSGMKLAPEVNRERFLTVEEVERLIASIERDENRIAAKAIMLLLLTGARRNEITHAKWENLDPEKRTLLVPLSKSGKPRLIALNSAAMDILQSMPRNADSPYIFPAPTTGRPSPSLHFPWTRIRVRAGLPDLRLHDLRHSFASFLVNKGVSLYVVQGLLGHSHSRYTQRYAHLASETLLDAAESLGDVLLKRRLEG